MNIWPSVLQTDHPAARILSAAGVSEHWSVGLAPLGTAAAFAVGREELLLAALTIPRAMGTPSPASLIAITPRIVAAATGIMVGDRLKGWRTVEPVSVETRNLSDFSGYRLDADPAVWMSEDDGVPSGHGILDGGALFLCPRDGGPELAVWCRSGPDVDLVANSVRVRRFLELLRTHGPARLWDVEGPLT